MDSPSTQNLHLLPNPQDLKQLCKSISAIEAIISPDWEYRYYSYQKNWSATEEVCEMRNGEGNQMLILFKQEGVIINGFAHESKMNGWKRIQEPIEMNFLQKLASKQKFKSVLAQQIWSGLLDNIPNIFNEFIYNQPIKSIGTTFCVWQTNSDSTWQIGNIKLPNDDYKDGSSKLLELLDGNPLTYQKWASSYYEELADDNTLNINAITRIYNGITISKDLALKINPSIDDFNKLKSDLDEIGYPYQF